MRQQLFQKSNKTQLLRDVKTKPAAAEVPDPFHLDAVGVYFHPLRLRLVIEEAALPGAGLLRGRLLDAESRRLRHITEVGHHSLSRPPFRSEGLYHLPVDVVLAPLAAAASPEVHEVIIANPAGPEVYTTTAFDGRPFMAQDFPMSPVNVKKSAQKSLAGRTAEFRLEATGG